MRRHDDLSSEDVGVLVGLMQAERIASERADQAYADLTERRQEIKDFLDSRQRLKDIGIEAECLVVDLVMTGQLVPAP